jgi:hypothetical protein
MEMQRALTVEEICTKLKPIFGNKIDEIYLKYAMASSREEKEEIEQVLNVLYHKNLSKLLDKSVLLNPPPQEAVQGEYPLATVSYAGKKLFPFSLKEKDWPRHVCISGMSGSGKTTLAFHVIDSLMQKNKPFLIFDWKKSFRPLTSVDNKIDLFTIGNESVSNLLKLNINEPPKGVSPKEWINVLCDLLSEVFFVSFGVHKILLETLDEAYREWGVYKGSKNYPTWNHIRWKLEQRVDKTKGREAGWLESALRVATVLTFGDFGSIVNYKGEDKINIEDLLDQKVILELNALSNIEKKFFCQFILAYIYKLKKANQNSTQEKFEHAILVDEAHNIFLKDKTHFVSESITDIIYREMREYGTSLICLDQHISKISDTVKGNSACHIAFQQQLPDDIYAISELMQLRDRKEFFSSLPVGTAIVKLSERHNLPFLVEVAPVELRKQNINDESIKMRMNGKRQEKILEDNPEDTFNQALTGKIKQEEPVIEPQIKETKAPEHEFLNEIQTEIYQTIQLRLRQGYKLNEIEKSILKNPYFKHSDVMKAVNQTFDEQLQKAIHLPASNHSVTTPERKAYKPKTPIKTAENSLELDSENLTAEQDRFLAFLQENPEHNLSTVQVYKQIGLSPRKGNNVKDELLGLELIKVSEIKNDKGWKKIIRLA